MVKKALLIEGARRIGKYTIAEKFGKNEYETYILIDFNKATITFSSKVAGLSLIAKSCSPSIIPLK